MKETDVFNFAEFLGMTEERSEEVRKFIDKNHKKSKGMMAEMTGLLSEFDDPKEIFYVAFQLGGNYQRMEQKRNQIEGLKKLLGCCGD
jgi:hypothetical protein